MARLSGKCMISRRAEVGDPGGDGDQACGGWFSVVAWASCGAGELGGGPGQVERDHRQHQPGCVGGEPAPVGRCARAEFFRSAWTCSMMAWPRWGLSAATVPAVGAAGGEEGVESPQIEQAVLPGRVQFGDPTYYQPARHLPADRPRGERRRQPGSPRSWPSPARFVSPSPTPRHRHRHLGTGPDSGPLATMAHVAWPGRFVDTRGRRRSGVASGTPYGDGLSELESI